VFQGGEAARCRSGYFAPLRQAAQARLPVATRATAVTRHDQPDAVLAQRLLGVPPRAEALEALFSPRDLAASGALLTVVQADRSATWSFITVATIVHLTVTRTGLGGAALEAAQALGPAWPGGTAVYQFAYPRGGLGPAPSLTDHLARLAAALVGHEASLVVVTGGVVQPPPGQYRAYWGPISFAGLFDPGSVARSCGGWQTRTVYEYSSRDGSLRPVQAHVLDLGNGGWIGFADGQFIVDSLHAGVDSVTWYAIPGLHVPA
jgi:hypothetical protein